MYKMNEAKDGTVIIRDLLDARVNLNVEKFSDIALSTTAEQYKEMVEILQKLIDFSNDQIESIKKQNIWKTEMKNLEQQIKENIANSRK